MDRSLLLLCWSDGAIGSVQPGARRLVARLLEAVAVELLASAEAEPASASPLAPADSCAPSSAPAVAAVSDECAALHTRILRLLGPSLGSRALQHVGELRQARSGVAAANLGTPAALALAHPDEPVRSWLPVPTRLANSLAGYSETLVAPLSAAASPAPSDPAATAAAAPAASFSLPCLRDLTACLEWIAIECFRAATAAAQRKDAHAEAIASAAGAPSDDGDGDSSDDGDITDEESPNGEPRRPLPSVGLAAVLTAVSSDSALRALIEQLPPASASLFDARRCVGAEETYPRTHSRLASLCRRYAWYHRPAAVRSLLRDWLAGEAAECGWVARGIRPVAWLGASCEPQWSCGPAQWSAQRGYTERSDSSCLPYLSASFDLIDAEGREFPLLVEARLTRIQATPTIRVFDRSQGCGSPRPPLSLQSHRDGFARLPCARLSSPSVCSLVCVQNRFSAWNPKQTSIAAMLRIRRHPLQLRWPLRLQPSMLPQTPPLPPLPSSLCVPPLLPLLLAFPLNLL